MFRAPELRPDLSLTDSPESADSDSLEDLRSRVGEEVALTLERSADRGFLSDAPVGAQIDHALGFVHAARLELGRPPVTAADLGTGGGIPGLVMGACWPDCRTVLMDASQRRTEFLSDELSTWSSRTDLTVIRGRVEELARDEQWRGYFEVVTARSFAPPPVTAECGAALLAVGGVMVVSEPPGDHTANQTENRWSDEGLEELGLNRSSRIRFAGRFGYQVLVKRRPTPERYPRRVGIPAKRPLF
jgi:16S rRNA (guanine527-N7)-methyltransferase